MRNARFAAVMATAVLALAASGDRALAGKKAPLDAGLFADYAASDGTSVNFTICGATQNSSGCYGGASMSPFERACAVLGGTPKQKGDVVTRAIYVLDKRNSAKSPVTLSVYTRTDTISDSYDSVQVSLTKQIELDVKGGPKSHCFMAANDSFVYAGTDADAQIAVIDKTALSASPLAGSATLVSITADERGYVAVVFQGEFDVFNPAGIGEVGGGGQAYQVETRNAWKLD